MKSFSTNLLLSTISILIALLAVELILTLLDFQKLYTGVKEIDNQTAATWWKCDTKLGCYFDRDEVHHYFSVVDERSNSSMYHRLKRENINPQGFFDQDDFSVAPPPGQHRILALGDFFTWGASVGKESGYIEILERETHSIVWNTAVPATGTEHQLINLERFLSVMNPNLILIGVYSNDLRDNVFPIDRWFRRIDGLAVQQYRLQPDLMPYRLGT